MPNSFRKQNFSELSKAALGALDDRVELIRDRQITAVERAEVIVDCIFGTGFSGELREDMRELFSALEKSNAFKIACDIPSGAQAQSGQVCKLAFRADMTVTMHAKKLGMGIDPAKTFCGEIRVADIGIPKEVDDTSEMKCRIVQLSEREAAGLLPERAPWSHKGDCGKLVCICGSESYIGAAAISAEAAMRCGAGLTELCTPEKVIGAVAARIPECTFTPLISDSQGFIMFENLDKILSRIEKATAVLIGCGLGNTLHTQKLVAALVERCNVPLVIDADGINSLSVNIDVLKKKRSSVILTPHPAELARLCKVSTAEVMKDRFAYAKALSERYGVTVVAKSAQTLIVRGEDCCLCDYGCNALSKGGSGDMLAGMTASFAAQGCDELQAGLLGCLIMGKASRLACEGSSPRAVLASDVLYSMGRALGELETE